QKDKNQTWIVHKQGYKYLLTRDFYNADSKLSNMREKNIQFTTISPAPPLFMYWISAQNSQYFTRKVNEGISEFVESHHKQFCGFATIPLQDHNLAIRELEYATSL